ncbi:MAG: site-specific recombinase for integration and excision [Conexibacter sp.]|nr:site-specific recombinase for integration and excision [Conexibacter sp.]
MRKLPNAADVSTGLIPAVVYAAKSTEDRHASIPTQLEEGHEMAEENGWTVVFEDKDEGFSAYSGNRGPGLERAKAAAVAAAAAHGVPCMLIAQAHDRLARGAGDAPGAPQHLVELWIELRRKSVHLRTVEDDFDMRDVQSVAAIGQRAMMDSRRKSKSVRKGMARRAATGLHNGRAAYGYAYEGGRWVVDPAEAQVVRRIFDEWLSGVSQYTINQRLNADGVRTQKGGEWSQGTVSKLLRNAQYLGLPHAPTAAEPSKAGDPPCACGHEAIVPVEVFEQAQALLGGRHNEGGPNRRTASGHLFLNGFLRCGLCGSPLGPRTDKRRGYEVYNCMRARNHGAGACSMPVVHRDLLETSVVQHFLATKLDVEAMQVQHAETVERRLAEVTERRAESERSAMRAADRLARVRRAFQDGHLEAEDWAEQRRDLAAEQAAAEEQVERMTARETELRAVLSARDVESEVLAFLADVREAMLAPVRDAETLDALRAGFRRIYRSFHVYPAGSAEAIALAGAAGERGMVVAPTDRDGSFLGSGDGLRVALPVATHSYAEGFARKSSAPEEKARSRSVSPDRPLNSSSGVSGSIRLTSPSAARTRRATSRPEPSGRPTSSTQRSGNFVSSRRSASAAVSATSSSQPSAVSSSARNVRVVASSSATRMVAGVSWVMPP